MCLSFFFEVALPRLSRSLQHVAVRVVFPAMINTPQAARFVATVKQRGAAVRTVFAQQTDLTLGITEGDQVFAQKSHAHGRTVPRRNFFRQKCRNPIAPHQLSHRGARADARQNFIFFTGKHYCGPPVGSN
jgi:hypothetical protein